MHSPPHRVCIVEATSTSLSRGASDDEGDDDEETVIGTLPIKYIEDESEATPEEIPPDYSQNPTLLFTILAVTAVISLGFGVVFYSWYNDWPFLTSLLCATSVLLGPIYDVPSQPHPFYGYGFTIIYFIYGQSLFVFTISSAVAYVVTKAPELAATQRHKFLDVREPEDLDGDGRIGIADYVKYYCTEFLYYIEWEGHKMRYRIIIFAVFWVFIGVAYGMIYEQWKFWTSVYFTFNLLFQMALANPVCVGDDPSNCSFGDFRAIFLTVYIIIGCPLFTLAVAQFGGVLVEHAIREHERQVLRKPLTKVEYIFAANLYGNDDMLSLEEFTILELLRLQRVSMDDLKQIKDLFNAIDDQDTGVIDTPMLAKHSLLGVGYGSTGTDHAYALNTFINGATEKTSLLETPTGRGRSNSRTTTEPEERPHHRRDNSRGTSRGTSYSRLSHGGDESSSGASDIPYSIRRMTFAEYNDNVLPLALERSLPSEYGEEEEEGDGDSEHMEAISEHNSEDNDDAMSRTGSRASASRASFSSRSRFRRATDAV
jgi:hypothetical protein